MITELRKLNEHEVKAIREALECYINLHSSKESWSQRVVLTDMLNCLWWESKHEKEKSGQ